MWFRFAGLLLIGYLLMSRSFAYLGIPPLGIYIGEVSLAGFLLFGPRTRQGPWLRVAFRARRLKRVASLLLVTLSYGAFQALRGIAAGYPTFVALRDTAFNYYPLFLLLGVWVGLRDAGFLRCFVRTLAWWNGCYGLAYILLLNRLPWTMPGTSNAPSVVPLFGQPGFSGVALLGLIAFEPRLRRVWHLVALNAFVMLGVLVRAEWLGFLVGLLVFGWCTKQLKRLASISAPVVALLALMLVTNFSIPAPLGRGGEISVDSIFARGLAVISQDAAVDFAAWRRIDSAAGDITFRTVWWAEIWNAVHKSTLRALFGFGYGYPIGDLNPAIEPTEFIRTPHSVFFYALGFSGWVGVALFALLQAELVRLLLRGFRASGQPFGLMCWAMLFTGSFFGNFFEAPFGAIPFYLLVGVALAPGLLRPAASPAPGAKWGVPLRTRTAES